MFVSLRDKSFLSKIAISEDINHFKIMGQDQLGLWVEHPQLTFKYKLDENQRKNKNRMDPPQCSFSIYPIFTSNYSAL